MNISEISSLVDMYRGLRDADKELPQPLVLLLAGVFVEACPEIWDMLIELDDGGYDQQEAAGVILRQMTGAEATK